MKKILVRSACLILAFDVTLHATAAFAQTGALKLDRAQVESMVRRSYPYVVTYNAINKVAMESGPMTTGGWNRLKRNTKLADATFRAFARPNNDTLYEIAMLDLRNEPMILATPAFESNFVSLETLSYDHSIAIPMSTRQGDYQKPQKLLLYTARTTGYKAGDYIAGIDRYLQMSGDFVMALHRIMPHADDAARFRRIAEQIDSLQLITLSDYLGRAAKVGDATFPDTGKSDADTFGNNLLEVMQFIFNHTTFDPKNDLDQALLAVYKPLGVEPGKEWDPAKAAKLDDAMFRQVAEEVRKANLALWGDSTRVAAFIPRLNASKGQADLATLVLNAVVCPIGQPAIEAMYWPVHTADGKPMNALHDYVVRMTKSEMPPAGAFWSVTLYDTSNGFFIPNQRNKYSVGENAGYRPDANGGVEIHIAAQKPAGVPEQNWLPVDRGDLAIDLVLRVYAPDLEKMKTWKAPRALLVK